MRLRTLAPLLACLILAACGAYQPPTPARSAVEQRQTSVALERRPTLAALGDGPTPAPRPTAPSLNELLAISADDPRALGNPAAPVTIIELTDFECPFCQQFVRETRPQIIEQFVDTGVVRFVARDLPLSDLHPSAVVAAIAGRCAADQNKFWPMYEQLFRTHDTEWGGYPERDSKLFVTFAGQLGLDVDAFTACTGDPATEQAVKAEASAITRLGINVTPTFFVNGQQLRGAQPFKAFEALIEQAAARGDSR